MCIWGRLMGSMDASWCLIRGAPHLYLQTEIPGVHFSGTDGALQEMNGRAVGIKERATESLNLLFCAVFVALGIAGNHLVDDSVFKRLRRTHEEVSICICADTVDIMAGVVR